MYAGRSLTASIWRKENERRRRGVRESPSATFRAAPGTRFAVLLRRGLGFRLAIHRTQWLTSGPVHITPSCLLRSTTGHIVQKSAAVNTTGTPSSLKTGT